jgi:hypothetical protein
VLGQRDPYSFENQLRCCELGDVDDYDYDGVDVDVDDDDDDDDCGNFKG